MAIDVVGEIAPAELRRGERLRRRPGFWFFAVVVLVIVGLSWLPVEPAGPLSARTKAGLFAAVVLFALFRLIDPASLRSGAERAPKPLVASFSDVGMLTKDGEEMKRIPWSQFKRARADQHVLVLLNRDSTYEVVPWRLLGQVGGDLLRQLLAKRLRRAS